MRTIAISENAEVEIISSYAATNQQLPGVASAPAWVVIGAFWMPVDATVKLEAIGSVTLAGLTLQVRLFDVVAAAVVSGSTTDLITSTTDARVVSGALVLPGGKLYQMQAQCLGDTAQFGIVRSAQMV